MAACALSARSESSSRDESFHATMVNAAGDRRDGCRKEECEREMDGNWGARQVALGMGDVRAQLPGLANWAAAGRSERATAPISAHSHGPRARRDYHDISTPQRRKEVVCGGGRAQQPHMCICLLPA
jgi:hypothetical protein